MRPAALRCRRAAAAPFSSRQSRRPRAGRRRRSVSRPLIGCPTRGRRHRAPPDVSPKRSIRTGRSVCATRVLRFTPPSLQRPGGGTGRRFDSRLRRRPRRPRAQSGLPRRYRPPAAVPPPRSRRRKALRRRPAGRKRRDVSQRRLLRGEPVKIVALRLQQIRHDVRPNVRRAETDTPARRHSHGSR